MRFSSYYLLRNNTLKQIRLSSLEQCVRVLKHKCSKNYKSDYLRKCILKIIGTFLLAKKHVHSSGLLRRNDIIIAEYNNSAERIKLNANAKTLKRIPTYEQ